MTGDLTLVLALPAAETVATVTATAAELAGLAERLGVPAVLSLTCRFHLRPRHGGRFEARGTLDARTMLACRVSLDVFAHDLHEPFAVVFVPPDSIDRESEPDPDATDESPYGPAGLPLGEAAVEELALALPPYPRKPGAELPDVATDASANPFSALSSFVPPG